MVFHAGNTYYRHHVSTTWDGEDVPGPRCVLFKVLPVPFHYLVPIRAGIPGAIQHHGVKRWGGPRRGLRNLRKPRPVVSRKIIAQGHSHLIANSTASSLRAKLKW
jgi:hypothetical protein